MELTARDWMVIVGILLIVAVLLDAYRRVRAERNPRLRATHEDAEEPVDGDERSASDLARFKELPNGGARVIRRSDLLAGRARQQGDDPDDVLLGGISSRADDDHEGSENGAGQGGDIGDGRGQRLPLDDEPAALPRQLDPEVIMLNVLARSPRGFSGEDILQILLACDLRFGDMSFFHRHEFEAGKGAIQFSVSNMMQPGVFDIDNMSDLRTPGLMFFLTLPGPEDMMKAFDFMLETAQAVARNLGGDVLDETRSALTQQMLSHTRSQIRDLERRLLTQNNRS